MLAYIFFRLAERLIHWTPFSVIYIKARGIAFIIHRIVGYRLKVVRGNLEKVFGTSDQKQVNRIERKFYDFLGQMMFESLKSYRMNEKQLRRRIIYNDKEIIETLLSSGKSVIIDAGHINNWEWLAVSLPLQFSCPVYGIYKPIHNKKLDSFVKQSRGRTGMKLLPVKETGLAFRHALENPAIFLMISDQSPVQEDKAHWTMFLGQEAGFLHGPEVYAKKFGAAIVFGKMIQISNGYYTMNFEALYDGNEILPEGQITVRFARKLESQIMQQPHRWLWSHKRFKKQKPKSRVLLEG